MRALALLFAWLLASAAHADAELTRLSPTAASVQAERSARLERRLTATLAALPDVEHVELLLHLPLASENALDRELPHARASVLVRHRGAFDRAPVFALLHSAVPTLAPEDITILAVSADPPRAAAAHALLVSVGPFRVAAESASALRVALAVSLAIHALFAAIVLWRLRANRSLVRKVDPGARSANPP